LPSAFLVALVGVFPAAGAGLPGCVGRTPRRPCCPTTCSGSGSWFARTGGWGYSDACDRPRPCEGASWCALACAPAVDSGGACEYADDMGMYEGDGWRGLSGGCGMLALPLGAEVTGVWGVWGLLLWPPYDIGANDAPLCSGGSVGSWFCAPL
jgi:hypothetical protein